MEVRLDYPSAQLEVSPSSVFLGAANWSTGAALTVGAIQDAEGEGTQVYSISHSVVSTDELYGDGPLFIPSPNVSVTVYDDDAGDPPPLTPS